MAMRDDDLTVSAVYVLQASLRLTCEGCGRAVTKDALWLLTEKKFAMTTRMGAIRSKLVCGDCGSRRVDLEVVLRRSS